MNGLYVELLRRQKRDAANQEKLIGFCKSVYIQNMSVEAAFVGFNETEPKNLLLHCRGYSRFYKAYALYNMLSTYEAKIGAEAYDTKAGENYNSVTAKILATAKEAHRLVQEVYALPHVNGTFLESYVKHIDTVWITPKCLK